MPTAEASLHLRVGLTATGAWVVSCMAPASIQPDPRRSACRPYSGHIVPDCCQHRRRDGAILGQQIQPHPPLGIHQSPAGLLVLLEAQQYAASWRRLGCRLAARRGRTCLGGCAGDISRLGDCALAGHRAACQAEDGVDPSAEVADLLRTNGCCHLHTRMRLWLRLCGDGYA